MSSRLTRFAVALASVAPFALAGCGKEPERDAAPQTSPSVTHASTAAAPAPTKGEGWNPSQIDWQPYEAGLAQAKAQKKPVCLVFYTGWCPHCRNYSHVFDDPRVVTSARDFVMVHLDADANEAVASKYSPDGAYIPRTFFLAPDGTVDGSIHAPRPSSRFFYDEHDPGSLLAAMDVARKKLSLAN
jgi:thiol-disulfide isomerase/thioredoxin